MRNLSTWLGVGAAVALAAVAGALLLGGGPDTGEPGAEEPSAAGEEGGPGAVLRAGAPAKVDAAPAALAYRIEGRVTEGGRGVPGVKVEAVRSGSVWDASDPGSWHANSPAKSFLDGLARMDDPKAEPAAADAEAETDAEGVFVLSPPRPGYYAVTARPAPPRVGSRGWTSVTASRPKGTVVLRLLTGSALRGRVLDAAGAPAAAVVAGSWSQEETRAWTEVSPVATDAATGDFALPAVPAGKGSLSVRLPGRASFHGFEVTTPYDGVYVIRLAPGGVVRGRVADAEGKPVAQADVTVSTSVEGGRGEGAASGCQGRSRTGEDGTYRLEGIVPGKVTAVSALAEGFVFESSSPPRAAWTGATVAEGRETTIDLVLSKGGSVFGRVVEAGGGKPIPKATVAAHRAQDVGGAWSAPMTATTADDGTYRIDGVALGKWVLLPSSPAHYLRAAEVAAAPAGPGGTGAPPELTVVIQKEGESAERNLEMVPGLPVRGRVVGPDGAPVAGARIRARNHGLARLSWQWGVSAMQNDEVATSGEDGAFEVPGLAPRDDWVLSAKKAPFLGEPSDPVRVAAGAPPPEVVLRLSIGASVSGRVLDASGDPVPGATVSYWTTESSYQENDQATAGADGEFSFGGVPPGTLQLSVWGQDRSAMHRVEDLKAGERRTGVEIRFGRTVAVSGVLVDSDGRPVPGRTLVASPPSGGATSHATTGSDGRFSFPHVPAGPLNVQVQDSTDGRNTSVGTVQAPSTDARLVLAARKKTLVSGRVTGPGGEPVPISSVAIGSRRRETYAGGTDPDEVVNGEFRREVDGEPPFDVSVTAPRDARGRPLNLRPKKTRLTDASVPLVIALEGGLEVAGRVVGPDDRGVEGVRLTAGPCSATSDAEGAFALVGLEGSEVEIAVRPPSRFVPVAPVRARVGEKALLVRLDAGATVSGRVLGPDGRGRPQVSVQASWKPSGQSYLSTDGDGRFRVEGLPPDAVVDLRIQAWGGMGGTGLQPEDVRGVRAGTEGLVVQLKAGVSIAGRVVGTDGSPLTGSNLQVVREGASPGTTQWGALAADGAFEVSGLAPGTYVLKVLRNGVAAAEVRVEAPSRNVRVEVAPPVKVAGRLEGPGDLSKFLVTAWGEGGTWNAASGTDGTFTLEVAAGAAFRVTASKADDDRYGLLERYAPSSGPLVLRIETGASIEGVVEESGGSQPWVFAGGDRFQARARADAEGRFRVRGLPPGKYRLEAWIAGRERVALPEPVDAGATGVRLRP